jgi:hypothetical protein
MGPFPFLNGLPRLVGGGTGPKAMGPFSCGGGVLERARRRVDVEEVGGGNGGQACGGTGAMGELTFSDGAASWPGCCLGAMHLGDRWRGSDIT